MIKNEMTLDEIRQAGIEALRNSLGPVGMVRFLQQYEKGVGNYTKERYKWLGDPDFDILVEDIRKKVNPDKNS